MIKFLTEVSIMTEVITDVSLCRSGKYLPTKLPGITFQKTII